MIQPVAWTDDGRGIRILDQRELPAREVYRELRSVDDVCEAIETLSVRGAPLIGIVGAMGLASCAECGAHDIERGLRDAAARIRATRPTAVNLGWALDRMLAAADCGLSEGAQLRRTLIGAANAILADDRAMCRRIGEHGAALIPDDANVITHCNTGALATGGIGTALAAIYTAVEHGKRVHVYADETRPLLQGSRLTAWELERAGIPVTVLVDGAAASLLRAGSIDACIVGADRIAANGDAANKVGTLPLALAARHYERPFYVAAPSSTFDSATASGDDIVIEQRGADEVRASWRMQTAPAGVSVYNPAFDVTPAELITAIISDRGVHRPPYEFSNAGRS
ncbi:MAG TPA: S-methyl-5-thioribose-1-phosphate isomerase [Gemmatimonadaceae bacterium]|nr:S-methyl-5-thioribose-1-phosphate isomerase [Gemmatimonadaceae bacterium]